MGMGILGILCGVVLIVLGRLTGRDNNGGQILITLGYVVAIFFAILTVTL